MEPLAAKTKGSSLFLRAIDFIDVLFFNVTTRTFKITYVAHIMFLLDSAALAPRTL